MNMIEKTKLYGAIAGLAAIPYIIVMVSELNIAEVAVKIVNLGLGLF